MQRRPSNANPDCVKKRDPDERSQLTQKKEIELDPDTQFQMRAFAASTNECSARADAGRDKDSRFCGAKDVGKTPLVSGVAGGERAR